MRAVTLEIEPARIAPRKIAHAVSVLHKGGVVAYPTDTVYALGCAIDSKRGAERIYRIKQMGERQRLAIICPDVSAAATYARFSGDAYRLARRILPGPYTLVLPATAEVPRTLLDKQRRQVGIRVPAHPIVHAIVAQLGRPLLTSSAVPPGSDRPCWDAEEVRAAFETGVDLIIDGGPTSGEPSTVLEFTEGGIDVLREGLGPLDDILDL